MAEITLTDDNFEKEVLKAKEPVLVDFWAPWCGPCKMQAPILEELAEEYQGKPIKIGKVNVDENSTSASKFQVMSIPTLIIFKAGKPIEQMMGIQDKNTLKEKIERLI